MRVRLLLLALLFALLSGSASANGVGKMLGMVGAARSAACSQASTFLARTSGLNAAHTNAYTTLICGMVTDGTWCGSLFGAFYVFATQDSTTALLNLCSASFNLTANGAPSFASDAGFTGVDASTTVYLDSGSNISAITNFALNSGHVSGWSFTNAASSATGGNIVGAFGTGNVDQSTISPKYSDGNAYCSLNDNVGDPGVANANSTGWYVCDRTDSTHTTLYKNASSISTPNVTSTAIPVAHFQVLGPGINPNGGTNFASGLQIAAASVGAHLSSAQVTSVYNRLCTFLTTVHGSC